MAEKKARMIFVTGTDTGVGKTVLTCLLLAHLRGARVDAVGLKPFCSGGRGDAEALRRVMGGCLTVEEINPFYFDKAVAPRAAVMGKAVGETPTAAGGTPALLKIYQMKRGATGELPRLKDVVNYVERMARGREAALIEGAGGLLVPLGEDYTVADLILALGAEVVVAGRNALGTINHSLLTVRHLQGLGVEQITVVLMGQEKGDASLGTNLTVLGEMAPEIRFFGVPFLGRKPLEGRGLKKSVNFLKKTLAEILDESIVSFPARKGGMIESRMINKTR